MKKRNGFIATSIMYSFFIVFSIVALITLASYSHYRTLIDNLNNSVLSELNNKISNKYVTIYNLINNGDFDDTTNNSWQYNNSEIVTKGNDYSSAYSGIYSARMNYSESNLSQSFSIKDKVNVDNKTHKIFVSFRVFRNGRVNGDDTISLNISGNNYTLDSSSLSGVFSNWNIYSQIVSVNVSDDTDWNLSFSIANNTSSKYVFIDNVMVCDITDVYLNDSTSDYSMKNHLDSYLDYFNGSYGMTKYDATSSEEEVPTDPDTPVKPVTTCSSYSTGKTWTFDYTGAEQTFTPDCDGYYKLEAWGAQGGSIGSYYGGKGAYTSGTINLEASKTIYVFVGESKNTGGYNGGGIGYQDANYGVGGGGSTDFRLSGTLWNDAGSLKSRIMVSAGGGGAGNRGDGYGDGDGGNAGGLIGSTGNVVNYTGTSGYIKSILTGGTQISGGTLTGTISNTAFNGSFGSGGPLAGTISKACVGGGGGYYGGSGGYHSGGGGGSSFISGYLGCVAITSSTSLTPRLDSNGAECTATSATSDITCSYHYSNKKFTNGVMKAGNEVMTTHDGTSTMTGNSGNGYAKITYIG